MQRRLCGGVGGADGGVSAEGEWSGKGNGSGKGDKYIFPQIVLYFLSNNKEWGAFLGKNSKKGMVFY